MTRLSQVTLRACAVAALLGVAAAQDEADITLVDGRALPGSLVRADGEVAVVRSGTSETRIPTLHLVAAQTRVVAADESPDPYNIYLAGGDRLRGAVVGSGENIAFDSAAIHALTLPLHRVTAVCVGTFFGQVQTNYRELFFKQQAAGGDAVIVNRGSKPFSFRAAVLEIRKDALVVRMGEEQRELARDKVYGFSRAPQADPTQPPGVLARIHFRDGGRITLPLEEITEARIMAGGATIERGEVTRIEFIGNHIAHLSDMQPVSADEVALFGKAAPWRADAMVLGGPLRLAGRSYPRGIGVQAKSQLEYAVGRRWGRLLVVCGIDDAASLEGEATFRVLGDGKLLHEVIRRRGEEPAVLRLDISGIDRLVLEALPGASYTSDLCDWAEARVFNDAGAAGSGGKSDGEDTSGK